MLLVGVVGGTKDFHGEGLVTVQFGNGESCGNVDVTGVFRAVDWPNVVSGV